MRKTFLLAALFAVASLNTYANGSVSAMTPTVTEIAAANSTVDGTYEGQAKPTKMNGKVQENPSEYDVTYTISNGVLTGSLDITSSSGYVHSVAITGSDVITGTGTYSISGTFSSSAMPVTLPITGSVRIDSVDGKDLTFTCTAYVGGVSATESIFTFTTE